MLHLLMLTKIFGQKCLKILILHTVTQVNLYKFENPNDLTRQAFVQKIAFANADIQRNLGSKVILKTFLSLFIYICIYIYYIILYIYIYIYIHNN